MANPLFYIPATCQLDITPGSSSRAAYYLLQAQYQFGVPIITNRAPAELAATIGVPLYSQIGDPGLIATIPGVVVVSFPNAVPTVTGTGFAVPVSTGTPGGTLAGVNYVDSNGVLHPDVDWQWAITVEPFFNQNAGNPPIGHFRAQLVSWTGDGTSARLIPTPFDLTKGVVAIWVNPQTSYTPSFRHSGMTGTGMSINPASATQGIMALQAGGFTVTDGAYCRVNTLGVQFTALVLQDTTNDNRYMQVGSYPGASTIDTSGAFTTGSSVVTCGSFVNTDIGRTFTTDPSVVFGGASAIAGIVDATHFLMSGTAIGTATEPIHAPVVARGILVSNGVGPHGYCSMVWVLGRVSVLVQASDDMAAGVAISYEEEAKSLTNQITALKDSTFIPFGVAFDIGTDNNVDNNGLTYYWVAFEIPPGDPVRQFFCTYKATGSGSDEVVTLPFTPALVTARQYTTGVPTSVWRGPLHTGTQSRNWDDTTNTAGGIVAMGGGTFTLSATIAPFGQDIYGFAVTNGDTLVGAPIYVPQTPPPPGTPGAPPTFPPGSPLPPIPGVPPGTGGCTTTVAAGVGVPPGTPGGPASVGAGADNDNPTGGVT